MPSTTRSAFHRVPEKTQNIAASQAPASQGQPVAEKKTEEVITISKAEYDRLVEAEKQLQALKQILNK